MLYGVPQNCRNKTTGRVERIQLAAENAGEEIMLSELDRALTEGTLKAFTVEFEDGRKIDLEMESKD